MIILTAPPEPFYYTCWMVLAENKTVMSNLSDSNLYPIMDVEDYLVSDIDLFKSIHLMMYGEEISEAADELLNFTYFDYIDLKYPTYSYY